MKPHLTGNLKSFSIFIRLATGTDTGLLYNLYIQFAKLKLLFL